MALPTKNGYTDIIPFSSASSDIKKLYFKTWSVIKDLPDLPDVGKLVSFCPDTEFPDNQIIVISGPTSSVSSESGDFQVATIKTGGGSDFARLRTSVGKFNTLGTKSSKSTEDSAYGEARGYLEKLRGFYKSWFSNKGKPREKTLVRIDVLDKGEKLFWDTVDRGASSNDVPDRLDNYLSTSAENCSFESLLSAEMNLSHVKPLNAKKLQIFVKQNGMSDALKHAIGKYALQTLQSSKFSEVEKKIEDMIEPYSSSRTPVYESVGEDEQILRRRAKSIFESRFKSNFNRPIRTLIQHQQIGESTTMVKSRAAVFLESCKKLGLKGKKIHESLSDSDLTKLVQKNESKIEAFATGKLKAWGNNPSKVIGMLFDQDVWVDQFAGFADIEDPDNEIVLSNCDAPFPIWIKVANTLGLDKVVTALEKAQKSL